MKRVMWLVFLSFILIVSGYNGTTEACLGARPLSMGGAFVAVADDIHSCYWNPAGMGNLQKSEITWMKTLNNEAMINYQNWTAAGIRIGKAGIGVSKVKAINVWGSEGIYTYYTNDDWTTLSFGGWGAGVFENTAMGVNIRKISHALERRDNIEFMVNGNTTREGMGYEADVTGYDVGFLHKLSDKVTLGLLVQDVNEPKFELNKKEKHHVRNFRPGIAWRPDGDTIVAMDVYCLNVKNVYDQELQSAVRIGAEKYLTDNLCVRAGFYGQAFHTLGVGLKSKPDEKSTAPKMLYQVDYGLLDSGDAGTHLLSVTLKW